jgi:hypothetical protein
MPPYMPLPTYIRLAQKMERDKHSSLFLPTGSEEEKSFITLTISFKIIKLFFTIGE